MFEIDEVNMRKTLQIPKKESRGRQMNHHGTAVDRESSTERGNSRCEDRKREYCIASTSHVGLLGGCSYGLGRSVKSGQV